MGNNLIINHRIPKDDVLNADYTKNVDGQNLLSFSTTYGAVNIVLTDAELDTFKNEIADLNQEYMLPSTVVSYSKIPALQPKANFYIQEGMLDGKLIISKEPKTNAPYIMFNTMEVKGYRRTIVLYLTTELVDKLDIITIRDVPFVFQPDSIQTVNLANQPNIVFTLSTGEFLSIEVPAASIVGLKTEAQTEYDYQIDPLNEQDSITVSPKNVFSQSIDADTIDSITVNHTSPDNMSYLQFSVTDVDNLRRSVYTVYIPFVIYEQFNTEIQLWT